MSLKSIIKYGSLFGNTGSFLVVVMKMVSLAFDLDNLQMGSVDSNKPVEPHTPEFMEYASYCIFPGTTVFGPFITFSEHVKFLNPTPLVSGAVSDLRTQCLIIVCCHKGHPCAWYMCVLKHLSHT